MHQHQWFATWFNSPMYHKLYEHRNVQEANTFITNIVQLLQLPASSKVLDVACGKGRHSIALAALGYDVTGTDIAANSIAIANEHAHERLRFFVHDMRTPFYSNYFDAALNCFTSFGYFETEREHHNALKSISNALKPQGYFVFDYLNVAYEQQRLQPLTVVKNEDTEFVITKWQTEQHFFKQIQVVNELTGIPRHINTERVAKFTVFQIEEMFLAHGLKIKQVFGSYDLKDFKGPNSERLIIVAQKN